ncbi:hypothetical protein DV737_g1388, partial [Chaetothyriales sp. CBS 132003]
MGLPRRALIAVTWAHAPPLYPDGKETGVLITEALHPYEVFKKAGFEQADWLKGEDKAAWENGESDFRQALDKGLKPSDVNPADYGIFFASAGHASLIDYPDATGLHGVAGKIFANGGIVSAVCHGSAIFPGIHAPNSDKSIIAGRRVTGFTTRGKEEEGDLDAIVSWNRRTIEKSAAAAGAIYVSPPGPWDSFTQTDGNIVTGASPASAEATAVAAVEAFEAVA